jgi:hypothetical protein
VKRLQQLDAGALLAQLPRTIDFEVWDRWDTDRHGTSIDALTDDHPGLMHHVATRVDEEEDQTKWVDFVVACANGAVNAFITVQLESNFSHDEYISEIFVKIEKL